MVSTLPDPRPAQPAGLRRVRSGRARSCCHRRASVLVGGIGLCAALMALGMGSSAAWAGNVRGEIDFQPKGVGGAKKRNEGFVPRIANPLRPTRSFDPSQELVVVLEGGPAEQGETRVRNVRYTLPGESFQQPLLAVVAPSEVEIKNTGVRTVTLYTPDDPDLLDAVEVAPQSIATLQIKEPHKVVTIRDQSSVHLTGRVVAFPHPYFAVVDSRGKFSLTGVPDGVWKVRLWYRDGWVEGVEGTVEVGKRDADITLKVPAEKVREAANK